MEQLEESRALEIAARCVVETGTATFYTTLHACAREPVLKQLTGLIRRDEVRHYQLSGTITLLHSMSEVHERLRPQCPCRMAVQMVPQPLDLNRALQKIAAPLLVRRAPRLMFARTKSRVVASSVVT